MAEPFRDELLRVAAILQEGGGPIDSRRELASGAVASPLALILCDPTDDLRVVRVGGKRVRRPLPQLALITTGRKSGKTYETPTGYWEEPGGSWLICASAAGAAKHPAWYRNLATAPDSAHIIIAGEEMAVTAEELHGKERAAGGAGRCEPSG